MITKYSFIILFIDLLIRANVCVCRNMFSCVKWTV